MALAVLAWWLSEHSLRPLCGDMIQQARNHLGDGAFVQNVLSQSLPVDLVCFFMLIGFYRAGVLPLPGLQGRISMIAKEGTIWGLLICGATIPLALSLGFKLGFAPNWQGMLGNLVSNSYEEMTYRVFIFSIAAYAFKNVWVGVFISAVLFALIHNQYPASLQFIVGLAGVFFSIAYIRSGSILAALWAHQLSDMILDSLLH